MIAQMTELRTDGKSTEEIVKELVKQINTLSANLQYALQNIDMSSVVADDGFSLAELYAAGALKGDPGIQGNPGKVYRPAVAVDGEITWTLTDEGGTLPDPQNIKGVGVPAGGTTGQVLAKLSNSDYDTGWITP